MLKNNKILIIGIIAFIAAMCYGATSSPWDGTTWDVTAPDIDQPIGNHYKEMYDLRKGVGIRIDKEHITLAGSSAGGEHLQGSARAFYLATASIPALQPDGTALAASDNGMLWHDITTNIYYILDDYSDPTIGNGWLPLSHFFGDIAVNTDKFTVAHATGNTLIAGTLTNTGLITANGGVTLGAGNDLIGSATSAINMNAFDVDENGVGTIGTSFDIAGTIAVVGTIDDDTMGTATDTTVATSESVKAYADSRADGGSPGFNNSAANPLVKSAVYQSQTSGFVTAYCDATLNEMTAYVGTLSDPSVTGVLVGRTDTAGSDAYKATISFFVAKDNYFQLLLTSQTVTITWTPVPVGGGRPILQP